MKVAKKLSKIAATVLAIVIISFAVPPSGGNNNIVSASNAGIELTLEEPEPIPQRFSTDPSFTETKQVIEEVKKQLRGYWKCLR